MNLIDLPHFFDDIDQPILITDADGKIIFLNTIMRDALKSQENAGEKYPDEHLQADISPLVEAINTRKLTRVSGEVMINSQRYSARCKTAHIDDKECFLVYPDLIDFKFSDVNAGLELISMSSDGLFKYHVASEEIIVSSGFYSVMGYKASDFQLSYSRWIAMIHPEDVPSYLKEFENLLYDAKASEVLEFRVLFKGGVYRWVRSKLKCLCLGEEKEPYAIIGNLEAIHEHRQIFESTKVIFKDMAKVRGNAFFKSMAYNAARILGVKYCVIAAPVDKDFSNMKSLAFWENGKFLKGFKYPLAGTPCENVINDKTYKVYSNHVDELFPEDTYLADNGIVSYWGVPFFNSRDEPVGHIFVMDDKPMVQENWIDSVLRLFAASIGTELERHDTRIRLREDKIRAEIQVRKRTRSLEEALVQLDTLFYKSSHDMRAPIATLEGLINILKKENPQIKTSRVMSMLDGNLADMKNLNASIGQIGNIRKHKVNLQSVKVYNVVAEVIKVLKEIYWENSQKIKIEVPQELEFVTDRSLLKEVLNNIIENAFKFSKGLHAEQPGQIHVRAVKEDDNILISVSDNGIGVSSDQQAKVFEMFFKGSEKNSGFGLGLYKTEIALSKIKGTMALESTEGKGTEVFVRMLQLENN